MGGTPIPRGVDLTWLYVGWSGKRDRCEGGDWLWASMLGCWVGMKRDVWVGIRKRWGVRSEIESR